MTHDITVYKTPALDLPLDQLIAKLQNKFGAAGMLDGLIHSTVEREVDKELDTNREVFRDILIANWDTFFPGVSIIDIDLNTEIDAFIEEKRPELTAILHNYVMRRAVVEGTPSLNLLLSTEVVQRTSEFPCNGKPHNFPHYDFDSKYYSSFVTGEKGEIYYDHLFPIRFEQNNLFFMKRVHSKKCGKLLRQASICVCPCYECKTVVKLRGAWFSYYCESCGETSEVGKIRNPRTSPYVEQLFLLYGLQLYHI